MEWYDLPKSFCFLQNVLIRNIGVLWQIQIVNWSLLKSVVKSNATCVKVLLNKWWLISSILVFTRNAYNLYYIFYNNNDFLGDHTYLYLQILRFERNELIVHMSLMRSFDLFTRKHRQVQRTACRRHYIVLKLTGALGYLKIFCSEQKGRNRVHTFGFYTRYLLIKLYLFLFGDYIANNDFVFTQIHHENGISYNVFTIYSPLVHSI